MARVKCDCGYGGCSCELFFSWSDGEKPHFVAEKRGTSVMVLVSDQDLASLVTVINKYLAESANESNGSGEGHSGHEQLGNPQC